MSVHEQLLHFDIDHLRFRDGTRAPPAEDMEPGQCPDHERAGADEEADGKHQELWRVPRDAASCESTVHPLLW